MRWGEAGQYGPPEPTAAAIEHVLAPRSSSSLSSQYKKNHHRHHIHDDHDH